MIHQLSKRTRQQLTDTDVNVGLVKMPHSESDHMNSTSICSPPCWWKLWVICVSGGRVVTPGVTRSGPLIAAYCHQKVAEQHCEPKIIPDSMSSGCERMWKVILQLSLWHTVHVRCTVDVYVAKFSMRGCVLPAISEEAVGTSPSHCSMRLRHVPQQVVSGHPGCWNWETSLWPFSLHVVFWKFSV